MALSLWYLYEDELLYCATRRQADVVKYLRHEPRCAFEIAGDLPPYCGVRGQGQARLDEALGPSVLKQLLERYLGDTNQKLKERLLAQQANEIAIIIKPLKLFTWDYSSRMEETGYGYGPKTCP
ncbi:MAG: hypothetical protein JW981_00805 [Anaerolineae bacterium]|nr:hypothetical protein [Anaerolineae bacterium]